MAKNKFRENKYGRVYGESVATPVARAAWPYLVTPRENTFPVQPGQPEPAPTYQMNFILDKDVPANQAWVKAQQAQIDAMTDQYNSKKKSGKIASLEAVVDGDDFNHEKYPYYKNAWLVVTRNTVKPSTVDEKRQALDPAEIKGGMQVKGIVCPHLDSKGVSWKLEIVQRIKDDGERFAGSFDRKQLFGMLDGEAPEEGEEEDVEDTEEETEEDAEVEDTEDDTEEEEDTEDEEDEPKKKSKAAKKGKAKALDLI